MTEDQNTILELRASIQELQNEVNCMNDSRDFKDAESVRSGLSHVPSQPALLPPYRDPGGLQSRNNQPPDIWNSQGISENVFANPRASSSSPCSGGFNPWISNVTEDTPVLTSTERPVTCGEHQIPDTVLTPRFQTGPSDGNSFDRKEGRFLKNYGADQQRLQISELHFDKFPTPTTLVCWKIRFNSEVCICSQFPTEALKNTWRKTIEEPIHMSTAEKSGRPERDPDLRCQSGPSAKDSVIFCGGDSSKNYGADQQRLQISDLHFDKFLNPATVDDLKSSRSIRGTHGPNFEVLDARIASALNRVIQNTRVKRKVSLEEMKAQKEDRFLRGRQIAYLIYEYFRVTGANDPVENYADLFTVVLRNDVFQEFDTKWTKFNCR